MSLLFRGSAGRRARDRRRPPLPAPVPVRGPDNQVVAALRLNRRRVGRAVLLFNAALLLLGVGGWGAWALYEMAVPAGWLGPAKAVTTGYGLRVELCYADSHTHFSSGLREGTTGRFVNARDEFELDGRRVVLLYDRRGPVVSRDPDAGRRSGPDLIEYGAPVVPLPPGTKTVRLSLPPGGGIRVEADGVPLRLE